MICEFCVKAILASGKPWGYHQKTLSDLQTSSACVFCARLLQDVEERCATSSPPLTNAANWPLHRWSVRRPGRIRESADAVIVTFRPTSHDGDRDTGQHDEQPALETALPERAFYLFPEEDLGCVPLQQELGVTTNLEDSGQQIKKWMQKCVTEHKYCRRHRSGDFVPTRLLAIGLPDQSRVRVIETKRHGIKGPYVTLSHCWGKDPLIKPLEVTVHNQKEFMEEGITWDALPENFKQAIEVGRFLGIQYIWIDSLCIIQGPGGDFHAEASLMHQVYRNSYCNIAAADSPDCRGGLFRSRTARDVLPARYKADGTSAIFEQKAWRVVPEDFWDAELLHAIIYTRGWVFQERMLAPRLLHFARHQIFWDCATTSACEALPSGLPQPLDTTAGPDRHWRGRLQESDSLRHRPLAGAADDSLERFWKAAVRSYTACELTKGRDKLIAIWGIAKLVRDALGEAYGPGLWERNLEEQLAWRVVECEADGRPEEQSHVPSWSWASVKGVVEVQDRMPQWRVEARDRMPRWQVVRGHEGEPIAFSLVGRKPSKQVEGRSDSWDEELAIMSQRLTKMEKKQQGGREASNHSAKKESQSKEVAEQGQTGSHAKADGDQPPKLQSISIPIRGHVGAAPLRRDALGGRWTLEIPECPEIGEEDGMLEVFPDVKPKFDDLGGKNWYFVVLASSKLNSNSEVVSAGGTHAHGGDEGDITYAYSGVGITLKPAERERHFYRTGALHFRGISANMWTRMHTTYCKEAASPDEYKDAEGLKFWLD